MAVHAVHSADQASSPAVVRIAAAGFVLALVAAAIAVSAGSGSRLGMWRFPTGFFLLRVAFIGALISALVSLGGAIITRTRRHGFRLSLLGIAVSLVVMAVPLGWYLRALEMPRIHDITTDTINPPQFVADLPLRANAVNSSVYGGTEVAAKQHAAYPDVKPIFLSVPPDRAFDRALGVARSLKWQIVDEDRRDGRIEATDTTFWFGFTDDIVVRVREEAGGSRIDIRSESRVGVSDVGTNAARIRKFMKRV